jgi:beta-galactosidase/beta-glucuronidase
MLDDTLASPPNAHPAAPRKALGGTSDVAYPRPQLRRAAWQSLDGAWRFAFGDARAPEAVAWTHEITVPFPPESAASGVSDGNFHPVVWYERPFTVPPAWAGQRVLLHFGAVDYVATVWVNGHLVATHEGGHTPFWADITDALRGGLGAEQRVTVRAEDDPLDLHKPRGKQDWLKEPHSIWYPRTTGIWQSVWLEPVGAARVSALRVTPDVARFSLFVEAMCALPSGPDAASGRELQLELTLRRGEEVLARDTAAVRARGAHATVRHTLHLDDPGIDDARAHLLWSPESPTLLDLDVVLRRGDEVLDQVASYTALRSVEVRGGRFLLNGRPYFLRLALDQGYWDDTLLAAPSPEALRKDVELAKAMGFNGVRKHQKLEDPRYLFWADRLGLLVWAELPSAYAFSPETAARLTREWLEALARDYNHPCVVVWVAFNESWGVPDLPLVAAQRHLVAALYHLAKSLDPHRPVVGNDGWEHVVTDLLTIHDYSSDPETLRARYGTRAAAQESALNVRPAGRDIVLAGFENAVKVQGAPIILSEFGGVRYAPPQAGTAGWGYDQVESEEALLARYRALIEVASEVGLAGFCYTQFADTFQEQNGLLYSDRKPKVPLEDLYEATAQRRW